MDMANKDIDWYTIPMEQVFEKLECSMEGLTSEIVLKRLALFGPNNIKNDTFKWSRILRSCWRNFWSPQVLATIIWGAIQWGLNSVGLVPACFIVTLSCMVFNDLIDKYLHGKISETIAPFARKVEVLRDRMWSKEEASGLVPGDVIMIKAGDVVPADCRLLIGDALLIDQCALTGESSGVMKTECDVVYSGSICEQGESRAVIVATGVSIFFKKEAHQAKKDTYLDKVLTTIEKFTKWLVVIGISVEIIIMYGIQHREFRAVFGNLLVLIIVGIPLNFRLALLVSISGGFEDSAKGTILKRLLRVKEVAEMEVVCYDASLGTLTQNKPTILNDLIEVLAEGVDAEMVGSMADRACRNKNHSDHTTSEIYFCNLKDDDKVYNVCIGPPKKILSLAHNKEEIEGKVKSFSDKFRKSGFQSMAVACQEVTDGENLNDDTEVQWKLIGIVPVFNSPRSDSVEFITRASDLGIDVKIFTADPLEIAKETSRSLGKGMNTYPSFSLLRQIKDGTDCDSSVVNLIEKADGFSDVLPGHMHAIIEQLQSRKHVCAMTGKSVSDYYAMKKADIGVADLNACDAAREASDVLLTQPYPDVLLRCLLTSRKISHAIKISSIHAIASRLYSVLGLLLLALIWKFDFPPQVLFILLISHEVLTIRQELFYRVKPSAPPDLWRLTDILKTGTTLGISSVLMTLLFFWAVNNPNVFQMAFGVASLKVGDDEFDYERLLPLMSIHITMSRNTITLLAQSPHQSGVTLSRALYVFFLVLFPMLAFVMPLAYDLENDHRMWSKSYWGWVAITWLFNVVSHIVLLLLKFFIQS